MKAVRVTSYDPLTGEMIGSTVGDGEPELFDIPFVVSDTNELEDIARRLFEERSR